MDRWATRYSPLVVQAMFWSVLAIASIVANIADEDSLRAPRLAILIMGAVMTIYPCTLILTSSAVAASLPNRRLAKFGFGAAILPAMVPISDPLVDQVLGTVFILGVLAVTIAGGRAIKAAEQRYEVRDALDTFTAWLELYFAPIATAWLVHRRYRKIVASLAPNNALERPNGN